MKHLLLPLIALLVACGGHPTKHIPIDLTAQPAIEAVANTMAADGVALHVVWVPSSVRQKSRLWDASLAAVKSEIRCRQIDTLGEYRQLGPEVFKDGIHFSPDGMGPIVKAVKSVSERGRTLVIGDCTARSLEAYHPELEVEYMCRNGSSPMIGADAIAAGRHIGFANVVWLVFDLQLAKQACQPFHMPRDPAPPKASATGVFTRTVETTVRRDLAETSDYDDALAVNLYVDADGREFHVVELVMRDRKMIELGSIETSRTLIPWEVAQARNPELAEIQMLSDFLALDGMHAWLP